MCIPDRDRSGDGGVGELDMCRITAKKERKEINVVDNFLFFSGIPLEIILKQTN